MKDQPMLALLLGADTTKNRECIDVRVQAID